MATVAEWDAIIAALEAELLDGAAAPEEFETGAPGGGKLRVKRSRSEIRKDLMFAKRARWSANGMQPADPQMPGVDVDLIDTNGDSRS